MAHRLAPGRRSSLQRRLALLLLVLALAGGCDRPRGERAPLVLAAASLQESLNEAADAFAAEGHRRPTLSFAASSALARQVEAGAPADLFISADRQWMDRLARAKRIRAGSRRDLLGNALVLVAPAGGPAAVKLDAASLAAVLGKGRLAMADPDSVPAGLYGKASLSSLGLWPGVEAKLARAENVRAALALVERGEAELGIVYATDARAAKGVRVVAVLPEASHEPIVYPIALLAGSGKEADAFYRFLVSAKGQAIFAAHGFTAPGKS